MDINQLKTEIQKVIETAPEKALQNVLDFMKHIRSASQEQETKLESTKEIEALQEELA